MNEQTTQSASDALNHIMELELAGVVRYSHYALMIYGYNRIPNFHFARISKLRWKPSNMTSATSCAKAWHTKNPPWKPTRTCSASSKGSRYCSKNMPVK